MATKPHTVRVLMLDVSAAQASFWFDIFNAILVIGAVFVALGTYGSLRMGAVKERFADTRLGAAEATAASAEKEAAKANESAAKLKQSNLIMEVAVVDAQRQLEGERVERVRLQESVLPRQLSAAQSAALLDALMELTPKPNVKLTLMGDQEANLYG